MSRSTKFEPWWLFGVAMALLVLIGRATGLDDLALLAKPWPVFVLGGWVWRSREDRLGRLLAVGLLASGVGDVVLDLPGGFIAGVGTFALAHLLYIAAFLSEPAGRRPALARQLPFMVWVGGLLAWAVPRVGELGVPFAIYGLIICGMMGRAAARESRPVRPDERLLLAGAVLFGLSDSAIAIDRAGLLLPGREYWGILMYWAGQGLMALGAVRGAPSHATHSSSPPEQAGQEARRQRQGLAALTISTLLAAMMVPLPTAAAAPHPSLSAGLGTLLIYTWLVVAPGTRLHRPRWEKTLMASFLALMPVVYVNSLLLTRAGLCLDTPGVGAPESVGSGWLPLELLGIPVFAILALIGARRAPWVLGLGVMAHGLFWDSWHIGRAPFMPDWYSVACLIVDVGWGLWAVGRVSAWNEDVDVA